MEQAALERIIEAARCDRFPSLYLGGNQLSSLPQSICNLSNLTELYLRCNQLANLPENIGNLSNLAELNLRYNQLTSLPWSIGNLHNLTKLNLKYNQLASLPDSIGNLSRLTELDLGYNQLTSLPQSIKNLRNLTELYLEANPLEDLSILRLLPKLESVYFLGKCLPRRYWTKLSEWKPEWFLDEQDCEIKRKLIEQIESDKMQQQLGTFTPDFYLTSLSEDIGNFTDLKAIYLEGNQLNSLPESIGNLSGLRYLSLANNQLTNLPRSIGNLSNLIELCLNDNQLTNLPESIGNFSSLTKLNLSFNQLSDLPKSIGNLFKLTELCLHNNQLKNLPESMSNLLNLTQLTLDDNSFVDLSVLKNIPKLERVYYFGVYLPRQYWTKLSEWKPEWLLDEDNAEIRRTLIEQVGYERICAELNAVTLDTWREYTLLEIAGIEAIYDEYSNEYDDPIDREPMVLLKMTCPSTTHIHILRVPPEMESAEVAITWVNHGIHPDKFAIQT